MLEQQILLKWQKSNVKVMYHICLGMEENKSNKTKNGKKKKF
jgi:hypothetical protein